MAQIRIGKITQVIGAVLDVRYKEGELPKIYDALEIVRKDGTLLVAEVAQQLGDGIVRCIAMGPTDGGKSDRRTDPCSGRGEHAWQNV